MMWALEQGFEFHFELLEAGCPWVAYLTSLGLFITCDNGISSRGVENSK